MRRRALAGVLALGVAGSARAQVVNTVELHAPADPERSINIVILGNLFTKDRLTKDGPRQTAKTKADFWEPNVTDNPSYEKVARGINDYMFQWEPFKSYAPAFRVVRVDVQSSAETAGGGYFPDTPARTNKNWEDLVGKPPIDDKVLEVAAPSRPDNICFIHNEISNAAFNLPKFNFLPLGVNQARFSYNAVHELGHGLFGLADEYCEAGNRADTPENRQFFAGHPNIDFVRDPEQSKWARWVGKAGPWKDPFSKASDPGYPGLDGKTDLGCYPGGGGFPPGTAVFHPRPTCLMNKVYRNTIGDPPYCEVCREAAVTVIKNRVEFIKSTSPPADTTVDMPPGATQTFTLTTLYASGDGIVVDWILDKRNLTASRADTPAGGGGTQSALSVDVTPADLSGDGYHKLRALVRDKWSHPDKKAQPDLEYSWQLFVPPVPGSEGGLRPKQRRQ
jgi:hypothetical protein